MLCYALSFEGNEVQLFSLQEGDDDPNALINDSQSTIQGESRSYSGFDSVVFNENDDYSASDLGDGLVATPSRPSQPLIAQNRALALCNFRLVKYRKKIDAR